MINLEPRYASFNDCIENQIYTILDGMGYKNEFAYIDALKFRFDITSYTSKKWTTIGALIYENNDIYINNLSQFWNIDVQLSFCDWKNVDNQITESLSLGFPLIVFIDSYWCPWEVGIYKKYKKFIHGFIIKEITSDGYLCCDGHRGIKDCFILKKDLQDGFTGRIIRIINGNMEKKLPEWKLMFSSAVSREGSMLAPSWKNIEYFKQALDNALDMARELNGFAENFITIKRAPIMQAMERTKNDRKKYQWAIESIRSYFQLESMDDLKTIINLAQSSANKWKIVATMLMKIFYSSENKHKLKVIHILNEIISIEKNIFEIMLKISNQ